MLILACLRVIHVQPAADGDALTACQLFAATDDIVGDVMLEPLAPYASERWTHRPQLGSPVLSKIGSGNCPVNDQRSALRASICDSV